MNKPSNPKPMGLYSLEEKECGCKIKRYTGGRVLIVGCKNHESSTEYVCPTCKKKHQSKQLLRKCKWSHAL